MLVVGWTIRRHGLNLWKRKSPLSYLQCFTVAIKTNSLNTNAIDQGDRCTPQGWVIAVQWIAVSLPCSQWFGAHERQGREEAKEPGLFASSSYGTLWKHSCHFELSDLGYQAHLASPQIWTYKVQNLTLGCGKQSDLYFGIWFLYEI